MSFSPWTAKKWLLNVSTLAEQAKRSADDLHGPFYSVSDPFRKTEDNVFALVGENYRLLSAIAINNSFPCKTQNDNTVWNLLVQLVLNAEGFEDLSLRQLEVDYSLNRLG